ncbi:LysM-like peptidoglycan-binding domain-containing protein [Thaumasiovibrio sp. DFM-14]|uniref:LysM-like peptidoglycan-binding domain-containing protein n=1 Tax=Thaumasiovibrio sp. DFM-14 TaxID=3384792 RepID=UPI00399F4ABE
MAQAKRRKPTNQVQFDGQALKAKAFNVCMEGRQYIKRCNVHFQHAWDVVAERIPLLHRRVLVILIPVVLILWLLPSKEQDVSPSTTERRQVSIALPEVESKASTLPPVVVEQTIRPLQVEVATPSSPVVRQTETQPAPQQAEVSTEWRKHQIQQGETLAKIFRQRALPLSDLYAIAAIEGEDKPISRVRAGQILRFKQTDSGNVDVLQIERGSQEPVMYVRLADGTFFRSDR